MVKRSLEHYDPLPNTFLLSMLDSCIRKLCNVFYNPCFFDRAALLRRVKHISVNYNAIVYSAVQWSKQLDWVIGIFSSALQATRRYDPLCRPTSSSCIDRASAFGQKKSLLCCFGPLFEIFWCPVVILLIFSSNLSNLERIP